MLKQSANDNLRARQFFQQAVDLDAGFSAGYDGLAWTYLMESSAFRRVSIAEGCKKSEALARKRSSWIRRIQPRAHVLRSPSI